MTDEAPAAPLRPSVSPPAPAPAAGQLAGWRARIFAASWLSYFSYYFTRKNFSVAKKPMARELGLSTDALKWIDLASLTAYAIGQFVHGLLGDALGPRRLVALGMLTTAALSAAFGVSSLLGVFVLLWILGIHQLEANRRGLEMIVNATMELSRPRGLRRFAEGIVTQLCAVLGIGEEGLVCAAASVAGVSPYVLAAAGRYSAWIGQSLDSIPDDRVRHVLEDALGKRQHSFEKSTCLYFSTSGNHALAAFVDVDFVTFRHLQRGAQRLQAALSVQRDQDLIFDQQDRV